MKFHLFQPLLLILSISNSNAIPGAKRKANEMSLDSNEKANNQNNKFPTIEDEFDFADLPEIPDDLDDEAFLDIWDSILQDNIVSLSPIADDVNNIAPLFDLPEDLSDIPDDHDLDEELLALLNSDLQGDIVSLSPIAETEHDEEQLDDAFRLLFKEDISAPDAEANTLPSTSNSINKQPESYPDYSRKHPKTSKFVVLLFDLLESSETNNLLHILGWDKDGVTFYLNFADPKFYSDLMPILCPNAKKPDDYNLRHSLQYQLRIHEFKLILNDLNRRSYDRRKKSTDFYQREYFSKGRRDLLHMIKRSEKVLERNAKNNKKNKIKRLSIINSDFVFDHMKTIPLTADTAAVQSISKKLPRFINSLFDLLESSETKGLQNLIGWMGDGKIFYMNVDFNDKDFESYILSRLLPHSKGPIFSFRDQLSRQFHRYGFNKVNKVRNFWNYYRENFYKGRRDLLHLVKSKSLPKMRNNEMRRRL